MASGMTIWDDSSLAQLLAELTALDKATITVGFHSDGKPRQDGASTNAEIAAAHEFGTDTIPRRPFLAPALDKGQPQLADLQATLAGAVLDGKMKAEQAAGLVGEKAVTLVRAEILSDIPPVLEDATIEAKGSSRRLVDTGQMLGAVSYQVDLLGGDPPGA